MLKRTIAFVLCLLFCIGAFSACKEDTSSNMSSVADSSDVSSETPSNTSQPDDENTSSENGPIEQSLYGKWVAKVDITESVEKFMSSVYPESVVVVETVTVDYVLELYEDKKCVETLNAANVFYDAVLKTVEQHIRSLTSNVTTLNLQIAEFKSKYKKETVTINMNRKLSGTFSLRGDPKKSGTITLSGENLNSQRSFTLDGNSMTLVTIVDGRADPSTTRVYEKQPTE